MIYNAFDKQIEFHKSEARIRGALAGKRSGKTESGAVDTVIHIENQIGYNHSDIDPYTVLAIAPTHDMLRTISLKKFLAYASPFKPDYKAHVSEVHWHNGSILYGMSGDKPARIEGKKANFIWIDEVFQCKEQLFDEAMARVADTQGKIILTGSLGTQYSNPKNHWVYKRLKMKPSPDVELFEWTTSDNPYFPKEELLRLKNTLDPRTFKQMFTISWDISGTGLVYDDFDEGNLVRGYQYDPLLETSIVIDWGWNHPMACLFLQYDKLNDKVIQFDEIVGSKITLEKLHEQIQAKFRQYTTPRGTFRVHNWYCDIAGNQEREQTGFSNINWFKQKGIQFKYVRGAIQSTIPIVRSFIKDGAGKRRFFVDELRCPKTVDGMKNYSYPQQDGIITDENPVKKDDDCVDAVRYYFMNRHSDRVPKDTFTSFNRWSLGA